MVACFHGVSHALQVRGAGLSVPKISDTCYMDADGMRISNQIFCGDQTTLWFKKTRQLITLLIAQNTCFIRVALKITG